jgi:Raf kinase inhibitor-like YbhB/YbcL family protein
MNTVNEGKFEVQSNLPSGEPIPADYYGNLFGYSAQNLSPVLEWKNVPKGTQSFAVTFFDQDAPTGSGFWHYVLFDIPAGVNKIELGALSSGKIPTGSVESITDAGKPGFFGPCPPEGREHTYVYTVHALKAEKLGVPPSSTPAFVGFNLWANSLGKASFTIKAGKKK